MVVKVLLDVDREGDRPLLGHVDVGGRSYPFSGLLELVAVLTAAGDDPPASVS